MIESDFVNTDLMNLLIFIAIGFVAGWLAGRLVKGTGFNAVGNIIIGIIGSFLGKYLFSLVDFSTPGRVGEFVTAFFGAVVLVFLLKFVREK